MKNILKVKVCGLKTIQDVLAAKRADFLGYVFYPKSKRFIKGEEAKELISHSHSGQKNVGLFVNSDNNFIEYMANYLNLDFVQLHGEETSESIMMLKKKITNVKIIKSISIESKEDLKKAQKYKNICDMLLFDTKYSKESVPGGNGKSFDWNLLKKIDNNVEWFLAGGINSKNLKQAVKFTKTKIVDVSSGLEIKKGVKSKKKIEEFFKIAKSIRV